MWADGPITNVDLHEHGLRLQQQPREKRRPDLDRVKSISKLVEKAFLLQATLEEWISHTLPFASLYIAHPSLTWGIVTIG